MKIKFLKPTKPQLFLFALLTLVYILVMLFPYFRLTPLLTIYEFLYLPLIYALYLILYISGLWTIDIYLLFIIYAYLFSFAFFKLFYESKIKFIIFIFVFYPVLFFFTYLLIQCPYVLTIMSFGKTLSQIGCIY